MYNFSSLNKEQQEIYNNFKFSLCSNNSPLSKTKNEEDFRITFENELNSLLQNLGFISKGYENFSHESQNEYGRTDFQYGNTVIEYKKYNRLSDEKELEKAKIQTQKYLQDTRFKGFKVFAFLFDGVKIYSYIKDELDNISYDKDNSGEICNKFLDNLIFTIFDSGITTISPNNIKRDFGIIDKFNKLSDNTEILNLIRYMFKVLFNENNLNPRTLLLFKEWERMFKLSESDNGKHQDIKDRREVFSKIFDTIIDNNSEYKAFFILHTAISIIIKLFLTRAICDKVKIDDFYKIDNLKSIKDFFTNIENGKYFNKIGILNLTDNDFFAWYVKEDFNQEIASSLQKIIFKICNYENINIIKNTNMLDLFKELYINFIPKCVRHSFGEYYTPYYLAERVFLCATAGYKNLENKTFLDTNCGSGTFLSVFFNYKHKNLDEKIDFSEYTKGIVGIDLNPIAVLMARANILFQGLQKCQFEEFKKYEIPVYLADSLYVSNNIIIDNVECLDYKLNINGLEILNVDDFQITLPKELILKDDFIEIINNIEKHIINLDENKAYNELLSYLSDKVKASNKIKEIIQKTIKQLIKFEEKGLNSIWLKIFSNYFKVAIFDKFDFIIGNPPWVSWSVLPEKYRENIKANIRLDGLFSDDKNVGGNNLNICALIANKSCERWLADNGNFCFLMPKSILFNKSFQGFRKLIINNNEQLYLNEILDFSSAGEIFEGVGLDFCAYKISKKANNKDYIPIIEYKRSNKEILNNSWGWEYNKGYFTENNLYAIQLFNKDNNNYLITDNIQKVNRFKELIGECEYTFRKGVNMPFPMRLKFIRVSDNKDNGIFHPYIKIGNRLKVDTTREIELELAYIKPFVTAPMLKAGYNLNWDNDYCICPYEFGKKQPLALENLKATAPLIARYLLDNEELLSNKSDYNKRVQNFNEFYGILRMGVYVYNNVFLCIRDNTKLSPTIVTTIKTHWGKDITPLLDNHISYVSEVIDDRKKHIRFIDVIEAEYILERLNNKDVEEIILKSQDSRSISSRLPIKLEILCNSSLITL